MPNSLTKRFQRATARDNVLDRLDVLESFMREYMERDMEAADLAEIAPETGALSGEGITSGSGMKLLADVALSIDASKLITASAFNGNKVPLQEDETWAQRTLDTPVSYDASLRTAGKFYDIYMYWDSTTETLNLYLSEWTSSTVRGEAQTLIDGIPTLTSNPAYRFLQTLFIPVTGIPTFSGEYIPMQVAVDTKDPTGWVDPSAVTVTYDKTARTITLTGTLEYYWQGKKYTLASPWTSSAHNAANAEYYLYCLDGTNFAWSTSSWLFSYIMVAKAVYGASDKFGLREPHGMMPWQVHQAIHSKLGAWRDSGGLITAGTYLENSALDTSTTPGWDSAVIYDEDIPTTIAAWAQGTYTTLRIGASSVPTYDTAATFPFRSSGSYILINNPLTGGETAGTNNRYVNVYTILAPVTADAADSQKYRTLFLQPQTEYTTLTDAQAENPYGLSLGTLKGTLPELVFNCRITYVMARGDENTDKCRIATGGITYVIANGVSVTGSGGVPTHDIAGTAHTSSATSGQMLKADSNGLPVNATNTDAQVAAAVTASHAAVTITDTTSVNLTVTGQALSAALNALTGDVTTVAGGVATTIANDAVSNAKLANMAQNTIKGRVTASTGDPEDLTAANVRTVAGITVYDSETAQDAVGAMVGASLVYTDATPRLARAALTGDATASENSNAVTVVQASGAWATPGDISASITSDVNGWNPAGLSGASVIRVSSNADGWNITGLAGGADGRRITLANVGSYYISILNNSGSSSAANRFFTPGGNPIYLPASGAIELCYDATSARWRPATTATPSQFVTPSDIATPGSGVVGSVTSQYANASHIHALPGWMFTQAVTLNNTVAAGSTTYAPLGYTGAPSTTQYTTTVPDAQGFARLYVRLNSAQPATGSLVVYLRNTSVASDLITLTIPAGSGAGAYSEPLTTASVNAGVRMTFKIINNASSASGQIESVSVGYMGA
jgi:hypothetical protein